MESILTSIKRLLGIEEDDTNFDEEIIMHINDVFMTLTQLGVGPPEGFEIEDDTTTWQDYIPDMKKFAAVKTYIFKKVKLAFDSSTMAGPLIESYNRQIAEHEFRLNHAAEYE